MRLMSLRDAGEMKEVFLQIIIKFFHYICSHLVISKYKGVPVRAEIIPSNLMQLVLP